MSGKNFLDRMKKQADESGYSGSGGGGTIARILLEVGLHRYVAGHNFWSFWKPIGAAEGEMDRVGNELSERLLKAGSSELPMFGIKITIKKDVIGRDPFKADLQEFIPDWQDGYGLVVDAIKNLDLPIGETFYGKFQYKSNPYFVKKGEAAGKTETDQNGVARYPSIRLPIEKFSNEAAANEAAAKLAAGDSSSGNSASQWSDMLKKNYPDPIKFADDNTSDIHKIYNQIKGGTLPFAGAPPLPDPLNPMTAKKYVAVMYTCEAGDIDIILDMTPF